jgi:hypothetical protein
MLPVRKLISFKRSNGSIIYLILRKISRGKLKRQLLDTNVNITHSARRINKLKNNSEYKYLEVGVEYGFTLQGVKAKHKYAVDPNIKYMDNKKIKTFQMSSNEFFKSLHKNEFFDVIFLDGLHVSEQLLLDFCNAIMHIKEDSWILVDDVIPRDSISAIPDQNKSLSLRKSNENYGGVWHGDCYKILPILKKYFPQFDQYLIIYPDNPQLLVRLKRGCALPIVPLLSFKELVNEMKSITYLDVFNSKTMADYQIFIEEQLFIELNLL